MSCSHSYFFFIFLIKALGLKHNLLSHIMYHFYFKSTFIAFPIHQFLHWVRQDIYVLCPSLVALETLTVKSYGKTCSQPKREKGWNRRNFCQVNWVRARDSRCHLSTAITWSAVWYQVLESKYKTINLPGSFFKHRSSWLLARDISVKVVNSSHNQFMILFIMPFWNK